LVKDGLPQPASAFGKLYGFDFERDRAFWGIDHQGRPTLGISTVGVDSVRLGKILAEAGFRDVIMVDSGASTDLVYQGRSLGVFEPRPLPHVVGLAPPLAATECR
jgi:poly-beta-1,6-N-acetyl-D-glucosamine N-deacetylase